MSIIFASLLFTQAAAAQAETPPPPPCAGEEFHAFDFWVGEWNVYQPGSDEPSANSRIESVSGGCAIRETWMPFRGGHGASLTTYEPENGTWHQLWIGAEPGRVYFDGGMVDGSMVLTGYWGKDANGNPLLVRMTYTRLDDGSVRQYGEASKNHGRTWEEYFDLSYRPRAD